MAGGYLFLLLVIILNISSSFQTSNTVNPCCYYPCQNRGICVRYGQDQYECDCTRTGYYGKNCTIPEFWTRISNFVFPSAEVVYYILTHFKCIWDIINNSFLHDTVLRLLLSERSSLIPSPPTYNSAYRYLSWEGYYNTSYYTRLLPAVPDDCPTPMGTKGKLQLPDAALLVETFLKRETFIPDPQNSNLMFAFFAQHFTHQFLKTYKGMGRGFTKGLGHGVDLSHIYGQELERQHALRLFKDGKLKHQIINGEMYPPTVVDAPIHMVYPENIPKHKQFAMGQEVFGLLPGLMMYATIWLREHNRVCDILKKEHPFWNDEQLFQTTRVILIGQTLKIVVDDYVSHITRYHLNMDYNPEILFSVQFQYQNRISLEFNQLYHWHPLMPDSFNIRGQLYNYSSFIYNTSMLTDYGVEALVESFSKQRAGRIGGGKNLHPQLMEVAKVVIEDSRNLRLQPFNEYRKRFGLKPYSSFQDFTGETKISSQLESFYGDIDALEFYLGLILEKPLPGGLFGQTMLEIGAPISLKGLMGNPINSPLYWKPSTFGGETGFNIVKTASIRKLVCQNTKKCPFVAFHMPKAEKSPIYEGTKTTDEL